MATLELEILTPREIVARESQVTGIMIPANWGQMDILPQHADYVTSLTQGTVSYRIGTKQQSHNISGGMIAIKNGKATILVDSLLATVTDIKQAKK